GQPLHCCSCRRFTPCGSASRLAPRCSNTDDEQHMTDSLLIQRIEPDSPHVATLAAWEYRQWGQQGSGLSLAAATADFRRGCGFCGVPSVFAALVGEQPVGMARLVEEDMDSRPELTP